MNVRSYSGVQSPIERTLDERQNCKKGYALTEYVKLRPTAHPTCSMLVWRWTLGVSAALMARVGIPISAVRQSVTVTVAGRCRDGSVTPQEIGHAKGASKHMTSATWIAMFKVKYRPKTYTPQGLVVRGTVPLARDGEWPYTLHPCQLFHILYPAGKASWRSTFPQLLTVKQISR